LDSAGVELVIHPQSATGQTEEDLVQASQSRLLSAISLVVSSFLASLERGSKIETFIETNQKNVLLRLQTLSECTQSSPDSPPPSESATARLELAKAILESAGGEVTMCQPPSLILITLPKALAERTRNEERTAPHV